MKISAIATLLAAWAALFLAPATQAQPVPPVYHGCDAPPATFKHSYTVDPAAAGGDGSPRSPVGRIQQALAAARPGDVISLRSGRYGDLKITAVNAGFITLMAQPGAAPVFTSLTVS